MTTNNLLLILILGFIFLMYQDYRNKKSLKIKNDSSNKLLKLQLDETTAQNKLLVKKLEKEKDLEVERRKKELARINMLEKRKRELAWRIELLTRLKYIRRLKRIRRRYHRGVYRRRFRKVRPKRPVKKVIIVKRK